MSGDAVYALLAVGPAALGLAWLATGLVRRYALARSVIDVPNHRSSHSVPTPRGGGLAIAAAILLGGTVVVGLNLAPREVVWAFLGGGALIAAIGWLDDHYSIGAGVRIVVHLLAAVWAVGWLGGLPTLSLGSAALPLGPAGSIVAVLGMVWFTNLFNFMDGIDGLAGGEALTVGLVGAALLLYVGAPGLAALSALVAAASAGFLIWNWAPAKIFMGDVGSGLLGYLFAVLALASERQGAVPLLVWILLCGVFVFDATATLLRRAIRGERIQDAHRSHAYQRVLTAGWSHARVAGAALSLNGILALLALVSIRWPGLLPLCFALAAALLASVYLRVERVARM